MNSWIPFFWGGGGAGVGAGAGVGGGSFARHRWLQRRYGSTTLGLQAYSKFRKLGFWLVARCDCVGNLYQATSVGPLWVRGLTQS
jgi:hypothetical protein